MFFIGLNISDAIRTVLGGNGTVSDAARTVLGGDETISDAARTILGGNETISDAARTVLGGNETVSDAARTVLGNGETLTKVAETFLYNIGFLCVHTHAGFRMVRLERCVYMWLLGRIITIFIIFFTALRYVHLNISETKV